MISSVIPLAAQADFTLQLDFYGEDLTFRIAKEWQSVPLVRIDERSLRSLYELLEQRPHRDFVNQLLTYRQELRLNGWLYARLVQQVVLQIYGLNSREPAVEYTVYFLLAESGYDVRLTYLRNSLQVNAYTEDVLYEVPIIRDDGRQYANLSTFGQATTYMRSMNLLQQIPQPNGQSMSFTFDYWPAFKNSTQERTLAFVYDGIGYEWKVNYDAGVSALMRDYPLVNEHWYLEAPLSQALAESLLPQLRKAMEGKNQREQLELLVAFTRSAFAYQEDQKSFGGNKPMVADELFFYPFSDCEDRSALFYALAKVLLRLPMIVIAYDDHLSIGVAAESVAGDAVNYRGRRYIFCDPTGPENSHEVGRIPIGYENATFSIIGEYKE